MTAAIAAAAMRPPTTPPAIAPAFELLLCDVGVDVDDVPDFEVLGVMVDCETLIVDVGTRAAVPATSGESPTASAAVRFQLSPIDVSMKAHLGIAVPSGTGSGKIPGVAVEVQLNDHSE